jgi:succinate dehydrogenase / fumarate reductase membrane anchor subunit
MTTATKIKPTYESVAWKWMRYSGFLLIPLVWIHVLIKDVIVGVHAIDINYVALRWASIGWQVYDIALLSFAFAHGMNGLRQVTIEFVHSDRARRNVSMAIFILWIVVSAIGAVAIIAGARPELVN